MDDNDDSQDTLSQIANTHSQPIITLLLNIQHSREQRTKSLDRFLGNLECIYICPQDSKTFIREWINASHGHYVALSYTWSPSKYEDSESRHYHVQTRSRAHIHPSPVRDCVYHRITKYMRYNGVELLWIDRHCIPQQVDKDWARKQKKAALQSMDWVYKLSEHPVALLGRPIRSRMELALLTGILRGDFVYDDDEMGVYKLSQKWSWRLARAAIKLLYDITCDLWWQRAWTYQENYKAGEHMTLLISHNNNWEPQKLGAGDLFGNVPGELCISSADFSRQATRLCGAFQATLSSTPADDKKVKHVLSAAGRYTILLNETETMTPFIIAAVEKRGVGNLWDRLPIIANCCDYSCRLDAQRLRQENKSLSLSILAMCLLNGEILDNRPTGASAPHMSASQFLKENRCKITYASKGARYLAFNKGCRFRDVNLTKTGVETKGHLWKLGRIIHTDTFDQRLPWVDLSKNSRLDIMEHRCLRRLSEEIRLTSEQLADKIKYYLDEDAAGNDPFRIGENYMLMMAVELAEAVQEKKTLRLGRLRDSEGGPGMAIFIWENAHPRSGDKPAHVFTSFQTKNSGRAGYDGKDVHRHVSLEVGLQREADGVPHLYTKRWILGMCFFIGCSLENVVFPWPPGLKCI